MTDLTDDALRLMAKLDQAGADAEDANIVAEMASTMEVAGKASLMAVLMAVQYRLVRHGWLDAAEACTGLSLMVLDHLENER